MGFRVSSSDKAFGPGCKKDAVRMSIRLSLSFCLFPFFLFRAFRDGGNRVDFGYKRGCKKGECWSAGVGGSENYFKHLCWRQNFYASTFVYITHGQHSHYQKSVPAPLRRDVHLCLFPGWAHRLRRCKQVIRCGIFRVSLQCQ